ncbi:hypothetical protein QBC47DRAFT_69746 [Echria macrotheca]|uniref:Uncharacterized protein n=1 Tax=Echria macrotheca TaxID=438768 RepID=A0AAJ0B5Z2_9PEZI|nr:hypothetical protein QBC47DRAFT_69746 [Echria macrotheca]
MISLPLLLWCLSSSSFFSFLPSLSVFSLRHFPYETNRADHFFDHHQQQPSRHSLATIFTFLSMNFGNGGTYPFPIYPLWLLFQASYSYSLFRHHTQPTILRPRCSQLWPWVPSNRGMCRVLFFLYSASHMSLLCPGVRRTRGLVFGLFFISISGRVVDIYGGAGRSTVPGPFRRSAGRDKVGKAGAICARRRLYSRYTKDTDRRLGSVVDMIRLLDDEGWRRIVLLYRWRSR